ncbi:hypothetical protein BX070DRAFT_229944 [Coemansia spiralis]|nr:hypothetical protein BX070DRAFT_229944 [Coemansia spiralis]
MNVAYFVFLFALLICAASALQRNEDHGIIVSRGSLKTLGAVLFNLLCVYTYNVNKQQTVSYQREPKPYRLVFSSPHFTKYSSTDLLLEPIDIPQPSPSSLVALFNEDVPSAYSGLNNIITPVQMFVFVASLYVIGLMVLVYSHLFDEESYTSENEDAITNTNNYSKLLAAETELLELPSYSKPRQPKYGRIAISKLVAQRNQAMKESSNITLARRTSSRASTSTAVTSDDSGDN